MKKKILILAASSLIACGNVFAAITLGEGDIGSGDNGTSHYPTSATLSLNALTEGANYNVFCKIIDPDAKAYPVVVRFDIVNSGTPVHVYFDNNKLSTKQARLSDNNSHMVQFANVSRALGDTHVLFSWLEGDKTVDPIHYECYADASVGLAK